MVSDQDNDFWIEKNEMGKKCSGLIQIYLEKLV